MVFRRKLTRQSVYHSVFIFTIIYFILMYFQKRILLGIFQTQLSFSISNTIALLTSERALDEIINRAMNGAILTGVFLAIEILLFIIIIIHFLFKLWRVHYIEQLRKFDFLLVIGLLVLLLGSFYYAYILGSTTIDTFTTITHSLNRVTPKQLNLLLDKWQEFILNYQFTIDYLPRDIAMIIEYLKGLIANVQEIAQIPDVINHYFNRLSELKFHYFLLMSGGFGTLLVAQLFEYRLIAKSFKQLRSKNNQQSVENNVAENSATNEQLTQILADQQELMTKMIDLQAEKQQSADNNKSE